MRAQVTGIQPMGGEDIADMIAYIVTRPRHVAVNEVLIRWGPRRAGLTGWPRPERQLTARMITTTSRISSAITIDPTTAPVRPLAFFVPAWCWPRTGSPSGSWAATLRPGRPTTRGSSFCTYRHVTG